MEVINPQRLKNISPMPTHPIRIRFQFIRLYVRTYKKFFVMLSLCHNHFNLFIIAVNKKINLQTFPLSSYNTDAIE